MLKEIYVIKLKLHIQVFIRKYRSRLYLVKVWWFWQLCPLSLREKTIIKLPVNMAFELLAVCGGIWGVSTHQIQYISQHINNICLDTSNIFVFVYRLKKVRLSWTQCKENCAERKPSFLRSSSSNECKTTSTSEEIDDSTDTNYSDKRLRDMEEKEFIWPLNGNT